MAADKQHAHKLIERLAPSQLSEAVGMLEALLDPVALAIADAPIDNKPLSTSDQDALAEAREWSKRNKAIPHEQVMSELGTTQEEIDRFQKPK